MLLSRSLRYAAQKQLPVAAATTYSTTMPCRPQQRRDASTLSGFLMENPGLTSMVTVGGSVGGLILFAMHRYRISKPNEYLVRTGLGIKDILVSKQGFQFPFQTYAFISMNPETYAFDLHGMSNEKMEFVLPAVFTIGPKDDLEAISKYAKLIMENPAASTHINLKIGGFNYDRFFAGSDTEAASEKSQPSRQETLIRGIIEGETRLQAARMTIEQIFNDKKAFKDHIIENVQKELDQFGLVIRSANIKDLQDAVGSEYFSCMRQKKRSEAANTAKVDIAEEEKKGDIGQKNREAETRQRVADLESETVARENTAQEGIERSNAALSIVQSTAFRDKELARIEAENATKMRDVELTRAVEERRIALETERLRACEMSKAQVAAETHIKDAEGRANALRLEADAALYQKEKEAAGIQAVYEAQAQGIQQLLDACGGNSDALMQYLMLNGGMYEKLARANAEAIRGMEPKITVWNTGSSADTGNAGKPIADILKMLPPLMTTVHDQTGVKPPNWLMQLADNDHRK